MGIFQRIFKVAQAETHSVVDNNEKPGGSEGDCHTHEKRR
jgi:phage shock protein A